MRVWPVIPRVVLLVGLVWTPTTTALAQGEYHPGDVNCDSVLNSMDIIYLVNYVFKSGVAPCGNALTMTWPGESSGPQDHSAMSFGPGQIDTVRMDRIESCDLSSPVCVGLYLHNHDSLRTLQMPLRIQATSGNGFIRFDSLVWIDRLSDSASVDYAAWAPMETNGVSPDWVWLEIIDFITPVGKPPLDSGAGYLCQFCFTPTEEEADVRTYMANWGIYPDVGFVETIYEADEFDLIVRDGWVSLIDTSGSGDLNCDTHVTAADIISLVNVIFRSGP